MPGQWEFQIGPVGPLEVGDQVSWIFSEFLFEFFFSSFFFLPEKVKKNSLFSLSFFFSPTKKKKNSRS